MSARHAVLITTKKGQISDRKNGRRFRHFRSEHRSPTYLPTKNFGRKKPRRRSKSDQIRLVGDVSDRQTVAEWSELRRVFGRSGPNSDQTCDRISVGPLAPTNMHATPVGEL